MAQEKLVNLVNFWGFYRKAKVLCISVDMEQKKRLELEKQVFNVKRTVSPAQRCDLVGMKLEKVHELFQACHIRAKGVVFYNMYQFLSSDFLLLRISRSRYKREMKT